MRRVNRRGPSTRTPASPKKSSAVYTAEQRDQLQRGLRILARMVVHAHLRREASRNAPAPLEAPLDREPSVLSYESDDKIGRW